MSRTRRATIVRVFLVAAIVLTGLATVSQNRSALALEYSVTAGDVEGLIAAIESANDTSGPDTIVLAANATYTIEAAYDGGENGLPSLTSEITIVGNGATITRSDEADEFRILHVDENGIVYASNITISNGIMRRDAQHGGGISVQTGQLTLVGSTVTGNRGYWNGGGIAVEYAGSVTIIDCTISSNTTYWNGGGISSGYDTAVTVINSTISGNSSMGPAAIVSQESTLTLINSTISNNTSEDYGAVQLLTTVASMTNTIIAGNITTEGDPDFFGEAHGNNNLIGDGTNTIGLTNGVDGNLVGTSLAPLDPRLGPLALNGGPTMTMALLSDSPAIDAGTMATETPAFDQRGVSRPLGAGIDIGAFELEPIQISHVDLCKLTIEYSDQLAIARIACLTLTLAQRMELGRLSFFADYVMNIYRKQIQMAVSRNYISPMRGEELIVLSRQF